MAEKGTKVVTVPLNGAVAGRKMSDEQADLVKRTICAGATDDEMALFLMQCERTGLDPFSKQIHAVKRWDAKKRCEVMSIQVGIDGFRLVAERTGKLDGQEGPFWCGEDGIWRDVWTAKTHPLAAKVVVHRKGCKFPFAGVALWDEYKQEFKDRDSGQMRLTPFWQRMPAAQLAKCAEGLALRKAFPQELSGLYAPEEMGREDSREPAAPVRVIDAPATTMAVLPPPADPLAAGQAAADFVRRTAPQPAIWKRLTAQDAFFAGKGKIEPGVLLEEAEEALKTHLGPDPEKWPETDEARGRVAEWLAAWKADLETVTASSAAPAPAAAPWAKQGDDLFG